MRSNDGRAPHVAKQEERKNEAEKKVDLNGETFINCLPMDGKIEI